MTTGKTSLWKNLRRWLPGVLISVIAIVAVTHFADFKDLGKAFTQVHPLNLLLAVALTVVSLGTRALAWRVLLRRKASVVDAFFIINEGYLLNNLFPLRAGELGRALLMGRKSGLGTFRVLSTVVLERIFDLAMAAGLLLATLPLAFGMSWAKPVALTTLGLVIVGLIVLYIIARNSESFSGWVHRIGERWVLVKKWVLPQLDALLDGLKTITQPWQFLQSIFWIAVSWGIWVLLYYSMLVSIFPKAPLWWAAFTDGILAMGIALPSAPGGIGVYEASTVAALTLLGITASTALAYALIMHFIQFATTAVLGFWGLARDGRSLTDLFSEIQNRKQPEAGSEEQLTS